MKKLNQTEYEFTLLDTKAKFESILKLHPNLNIMMSYSAGMDSDTMLKYFAKYFPDIKMKIVMFNTGLEYEASLRHIEKRRSEGHEIEIIRPKIPIPVSVKKYGQPFMSKYVSEMLSRLQKHNFNFIEDGNKIYPDLLKKYSNCGIAIKWWCNWNGSEYDSNKEKNSNSMFAISRIKYLKEFLIIHGLPFKVSNKCCQFAKKNPSKTFEKANNINLVITGIRKAEGGIRARAYKICFNNKKKVKLYMPLFWWSNNHVKKFAESNQIRFSDCYEEYGLKRTGCVGCPYGKNYNFERQVVKRFEPKLSKAVEHIFKDTYELMDKYHFFKQQMNNRNKLTLGDWLK